MRVGRRAFVGTGLSAVALGLLARRGRGNPWLSASPDGVKGLLERSMPVERVGRFAPSVMVKGMPFAPGFSGDSFPDGVIPFHSGEAVFPGGVPPEPTEVVDVAIAGGGLSGLATAYLLRHRRPVVFEMQDRFGGVSRGEEWAGTRYSLGGAYFITPDKGTFLDEFYRELGLDKHYRLSEGDDPIEWNGGVLEEFFQGVGVPKGDVPAFLEYAAIVKHYAEKAYPDIPLDPKKDNAWILALDTISLKDDIAARMKSPMPTLLASAIQAYCFSSFDLSWDQVSAASGWNFIAAEEFGRWVLPGGNAWMAQALWERLADAYCRGDAKAGPTPERLRPGWRVVDVRSAAKGLIQVTSRGPQGQWRSLLARKVVMACSKHVCKYILHDLEAIDPERKQSMHAVATNPYLVANVLLEAPIERDFYDLFLLGDGALPLAQEGVAGNVPVVDALNGHYARVEPLDRSVLTLYWPLPYSTAMFGLIADTAWQDWASALVGQIERVLTVLEVPRSSVRQVRMTRWGHAMPLARTDFIAGGHPERLRAPFLDHVYFVNQDNWALPAVETCLLEAETFAAVIDEALKG